MRRRDDDGKEREQLLASYQAMNNPAKNVARVVTELRAGIGTRSHEWANEGATSESAASRHWIAGTAGKIAELRELKQKDREFIGTDTRRRGTRPKRSSRGGIGVSLVKARRRCWILSPVPARTRR